MSPNKKTVQKYMDGFNKSDHEQILSCLADDRVVYARRISFGRERCL